MIFGIFVLVPGLIYLTGNNLSSGFFGALSNLFGGVNPPAQVSISIDDAIMSEIQTRGTLVVYDSKINIRSIRVDYEGGVLNASGFGASYTAFGEVQIGVDLQNNAVDITRLDPQTYQINLPQPYIASCSLEPLQVLDKSTSMTADWDAAEDAAYIAAMNAMVQRAEDTGLLEEAQYQAELALNDILRDVAFTIANTPIDFDYVFAEADEILIDDSCVPPEHDKWIFCQNETSPGVWNNKSNDNPCET